MLIVSFLWGTVFVSDCLIHQQLYILLWDMYVIPCCSFSSTSRSPGNTNSLYQQWVDTSKTSLGNPPIFSGAIFCSNIKDITTEQKLKISLNFSTPKRIIWKLMPKCTLQDSWNFQNFSSSNSWILWNVTTWERFPNGVIPNPLFFPSFFA